MTGRITYALMRDGAFPYSDFWVKVDPKTKAPIRSLIFVFIIDAFLLLLPLASDVAFESIVGISTIGFYVSYGLPVLLKLVFAWDKFPSTEMSLGPYSNICGIVSCVWLFGTSILLILPPQYPVTLTSMNWTIVVLAGFGIFGVFYWHLYASKYFRGPTRKANDLEIIHKD